MIMGQILQLARTFGFAKAAIIDMEQVPFDHSFRKYCEKNLCGQYNTNYSCPPVCGSPEAMERRLRVYKKALVVQTIWDITDFHDHAAIHRAKASHNTAMLGLISNMRRGGHNGVMCGASYCTLCNTCEMAKGHPCVKPDQKFSCMSAYCIYVRKLADQCGMDYNCDDGKLTLFGLYAF